LENLCNFSPGLRLFSQEKTWTKFNQGYNKTVLMKYSNSAGIRESRLAFYEWNTERTFKETQRYVDGVDNPLDAVTHAAAAGVHVVTGIGDSILGDIIRVIQGKNNRVDLKNYSGALPRLKLDASEAIQSVGNVFRGKFLSILALPFIGLRAVGDAAADGVDALAGIKRPDYSMAA
jgi:hypothetical protein